MAKTSFVVLEYLIARLVFRSLEYVFHEKFLFCRVQLPPSECYQGQCLGVIRILAGQAFASFAPAAGLLALTATGPSVPLFLVLIVIQLFAQR